MNKRTFIVTMISTNMFFIGVFIFIQPYNTELSQKIGGDLIMLIPIPYVINWVFSKSNNEKPKEKSVSHD